MPVPSNAAVAKSYDVKFRYPLTWQDELEAAPPRDLRLSGRSYLPSQGLCARRAIDGMAEIAARFIQH